MNPTRLERMIETQIVARGVKDQRVLDAIRRFPREWFVPDELAAEAYSDTPLPIGQGQTISQPYIVALMTQLADVRPSDRVLEVGTGSAYQTAILSALAGEVFSAEIVESIARKAVERVQELRLPNVTVAYGDALEVFRNHGPFDVILSAAAPERVPDELVALLADGGRLVMPAGPADAQTLWKLERRGGEILRTDAGGVRFVPLIRQPK